MHLQSHGAQAHYKASPVIGCQIQGSGKELSVPETLESSCWSKWPTLNWMDQWSNVKKQLHNAQLHKLWMPFPTTGSLCTSICIQCF